MSKDVAKVRKTAARKQIVGEIKALQKINVALSKAMNVVNVNGCDLTGDTHHQLADLLSRMNIGVTIVTSSINERASDLARTFVK